MAIKVVEHSLKGEAAELEGARESLLAASISHPNVVWLPTHDRYAGARLQAGMHIITWSHMGGWFHGSFLLRAYHVG